MAASTNRSLFLQVGADVSPLQAQMKAGRTAILALADAAGDVQLEVQKRLAAISADPNSLKQLEQSFSASFNNIRRNAEQVLSAGGGASALKLIDAQGAQQAAAAAQANATQLRIAADAAAAFAAKEGEAGLAARALAAAIEVNALSAEKESIALTEQARVMSGVAAQAKLLGASENEVSAGHTRMGASGLIAEHVVRAFSDSIAAGQSPIRALTLELGRISEAVTLFAQTTDAKGTGAMAKFAGFMSGPWGLAISVGVAVLTPLIAKLAEGNSTLEEGVAKLKADASETALADAAHKAFTRTIEGEIAEQKKLNDELDRQVRTQRQNQQNTLRQAQQQVASEEKSRPGLAKEIAGQQGIVDRYKRGELPAGVDPNTALAAAAAAEQKLAELKVKLADLDQSIVNGHKAVREAEVPLISSDVAAAFDGKAAAALRYEKALGLLNNRFAIGAGNRGTIHQEQADGSFKDVTVTGIGQAAYARQLAALEAEKKAAEEKAAAAAKAANDTSQVGVVATVADATRIIESIGGQVTSGFRSRESQERLYADKLAGRHDGPVARPGTSDHERGQAIDVAYGPGISIGTIKAAFKEAGVHINQLIDEPGQRAFHVGFGQKGPSADTLARRQEAQVRKDANDDRAFTNANRSADDALARAKLQLTGGIEEEYKLKVEELGADLAAKNRALQDEVTAGRLSQVEADGLKAKNDGLYILQQINADSEKRIALPNAAFQTEQDESNARLAILRIDAALATTRAERLKIERQILDEEQAQRRGGLQHTIDVSKEGSPDRARAEQALGRLPGQEAAENKDFDKQHANQLDAYRDKLKSDVGDMNDALKGIEADGLKSIEDGFVGIISGTESVAQAFKHMADTIIADIARIVVEKALLSFLGFKDGGSVGSVTPQRNASGGPIFGAGSGTSDSILSWLSNGEFVVNSKAAAKHLPLLKAINDNSLPGFADGGFVGTLPSIPSGYPALPRAEQLRPLSQHVAITTTVEVQPSPLFDVRSRTIAQQTVAGAAQPIMAGATAQTMKKLRRQSLAGGYA